MDNAVDRLDEAIKLYVTKITRESLDERDGRRAMEIISFTINLEHIGDIIDKNLMELAAKKIKNKFQFSKEGAAELVALYVAPVFRSLACITAPETAAPSWSVTTPVIAPPLSWASAREAKSTQIAASNSSRIAASVLTL